MDPPVFRSRHSAPQPEAPARAWQLPLTAEDRSRCRGLRHTACGVPVLLQLPRGEALEPGEWLCSDGAQTHWLEVTAAPEPLLRVRSSDALALLQAAYHLGNRHVALEIRAGELRLLEDPVLAHLLEHRGLEVGRITAPFQPERGAYGHSHGHSTGHHHDPSPVAGRG